MNKDDNNILDLKNITKIFPGVIALDSVDSQIKKGEVHAFVGENGAGKSTLMNIIGGILQPEKGEILYKGKKIELKNPSIAKEKGIIVIHQELSLVPHLNVTENIFLGSLGKKIYSRVNWDIFEEKTKKALEKLKCDINPDDLVGSLSIAHQQMVEIARAITYEAEVVIFDEPTSSLTGEEIEILFENINLLKNQGVTVIYISHKLNEIFKLSDRISVLRDGKKRDTLITSETNEKEITNLMIGREIEDFYGEHENKDYGKEVLRVENLSKKELFSDISFSIKEGEIVGFYGLVGAGRTEMAETIFGIRKSDSGKIFIEGNEKKINHSKDAVKYGMGLIPEDRKEKGLILELSVLKNMRLTKIRNLNNYGFIKEKETYKIFEEYKDKLSISTTGPEQKVKNLSGGNQQKAVIAKWLSIDPKILILDEPTRGIDVGSKSEIHKLIKELAKDNMAVLIISSEMPEIMNVCDNIYSMYDGEITGKFTAEEITEEKLINAIT